MTSQDGRVVATLDDYAAVHGLVSEYIAEGVQASVPVTLRQTVEEVGHLVKSEGSATVKQIEEALRIDKSAASRRCRTAESRGYIRNEETSRGRPARYVIGDPLPAEQAVLPHPDALQSALIDGGGADGCGCTVAVQPEGYNPPPPSVSDAAVRDPEWRRVVL